jgi:hypothetical protein
MAVAQSTQEPAAQPAISAMDDSVALAMAQSMQARMEKMRTQASGACPVGFFVQRKAAHGLVVTKTPGGPDTTLGMGLDLGFRPRSLSIVEADITVHGMTPQARVIPASLNASEDAAESFALKATAAAPLTLSSVWMKRLGTISWVELTRLVFSDGTTWTPSGDAHCTSRPSLLLPVNASPQR